MKQRHEQDYELRDSFLESIVQHCIDQEKSEGAQLIEKVGILLILFPLSGGVFFLLYILIICFTFLTLFSF